MGSSLSVDEANPAQYFMTAMRTTHRRLEDGNGRGLDRGLWAASAFENGASARNVAVTAVVAGDAVMTDADQSRRQNVPGESADELDGAQSESFERGSA